MESLGEKLRTAREEQGLDYEFISREINISQRYLEALEREDFSPFPGEPYALGFLRNYSEFLGLNVDEVMSLYRSFKIEEQPIPVEELLRGPSRLPRIITICCIVIAALGIAFGIYYLASNRTERVPPQLPETRPAQEHTLSMDFLERRLYPGDSVLISSGAASYRMIFSNLGEVLTLTSPRGPVILDLGQEVTIDLDNDGYTRLRIVAADFVKNDSSSGALLRFEQEIVLQPVVSFEVPQEALVTPREPAVVLFTSPNPYPFTLQASFQGFCFFRYEILFEADRPGRNEQFHQRGDEINITAQNGIRLGTSNAQALRLQVIGGGRTVPFDLGGPGEVVAADLRWVRDEANQFALVLIALD
ncbi:MAG: helix-turn-helix domain-containing protein [Treponema sp.]|nr:helix-turn-helix domain-containing protein [Treponema sp.]